MPYRSLYDVMIALDVGELNTLTLRRTAEQLPGGWISDDEMMGDGEYLMSVAVEFDDEAQFLHALNTAVAMGVDDD